jgi:hypothetical protein
MDGAELSISELYWMKSKVYNLGNSW